MKKCVITGATGCLGMTLSRMLHESGVSVVALGRNRILARPLENMGIEFKSIDLLNQRALQRAFKGADTIFHCAALSSPFGRYQAFYEANVVGTQHVIEATPKHARLIHVSSPSIYFDFKTQYDIKENTVLPQKAANHYIKTKRMAEKLIQTAQEAQQLNAITIRPRGIFGPYDRSIFPNILNLAQNQSMPLFNDGKQKVDITYVDNVAHSLICAAQAPESCLGEVYNITNDEPQPLVHLLEQLFEAFHLDVTFRSYPYGLIKQLAKLIDYYHQLPWVTSEPRITPYTAGVMAFGKTLDISKAKTMLGYQPQVSIQTGIERYARWVKST